MVDRTRRLLCLGVLASAGCGRLIGGERTPPEIGQDTTSPYRPLDRPYVYHDDGETLRIVEPYGREVVASYTPEFDPPFSPLFSSAQVTLVHDRRVYNVFSGNRYRIEPGARVDRFGSSTLVVVSSDRVTLLTDETLQPQGEFDVDAGTWATGDGAFYWLDGGTLRGIRAPPTESNPPYERTALDIPVAGATLRTSGRRALVRSGNRVIVVDGGELIYDREFTGAVEDCLLQGPRLLTVTTEGDALVVESAFPNEQETPGAHPLRTAYRRRIPGAAYVSVGTSEGRDLLLVESDGAYELRRIDTEPRTLVSVDRRPADVLYFDGYVGIVRPDGVLVVHEMGAIEHTATYEFGSGTIGTSPYLAELARIGTP